MKNLKMIFILLAASSILFSCNKSKTKPQPANPPAVVSQQTSASEANRGPLILVASQYIYGRGGSYMSATFDQTTANFYGSGLYMHWSTTSSSGPWTNGVLPFSFSNPTGLYSFSVAFASGTTVYVFYSTSAGTSYPSGSASPVYSTIAP